MKSTTQTVSSITGKCINLDNIFTFPMYLSRLTEILKSYGYTLSFDSNYSNFQKQTSLDEEFEEKILFPVLKSTINSNLYNEAKNKIINLTESIEILISLESIYEIEKSKKIQELYKLMATAKLDRSPFSQIIYFQKFEKVYKQVSDLNLIDSLSYDEIKNIAYLGIRKSCYHHWAIEFEINHGYDSSNAYKHFTDLKQMKNKLRIYKTFHHFELFIFIAILTGLLIFSITVSVIAFKQQQYYSHKPKNYSNHYDNSNSNCDWFYHCDDSTKCDWVYSCDGEVMVQSSQ